MAVMGVLNSWDTLATKSLLRVSMRDRFSTMALKFSQVSLISLIWVSVSTRTLKSPRATCCEASDRRSMGSKMRRLM